MVFPDRPGKVYRVISSRKSDGEPVGKAVITGRGRAVPGKGDAAHLDWNTFPEKSRFGKRIAVGIPDLY